MSSHPAPSGPKNNDALHDQTRAKAKTATFRPVRPPLVIPNQMWEDIACWTAWLAYVAHDLIVIMKYENSFDVRMVDPESRLMQGPSLYWATACWEFARAHQAATDNPWHSAHNPRNVRKDGLPNKR